MCLDDINNTASIIQLDMVDTSNNMEDLLNKDLCSIEKIKKICYECPNNENVDHDKMVIYYQAPEVLTISLKRWQVNYNKPLYDENDHLIGYDSDKICTPINLPNCTTFAAKSYIPSTVVSHHSRDAEQGHFTGHIFEKFDETNQRIWTITDDGRVLQSRTGDPKEGYLYFFTADINNKKSSDDVSRQDPTLSSKHKSGTDDVNETANSKNETENSTHENNSEDIDQSNIYICKGCNKAFERIKAHLSLSNKKSSKCRKSYKEMELDELFRKISEQQTNKVKVAQKKFEEQNKDQRKEAWKNYKEQNKDKVKANNKNYKEKNKNKIKEANKQHHVKALKDLKNNPQQIFNNFMEKQSLGTLSYICVSCHRLLFKSGVAPFDGPKTEDMHKKIKEAELEYCVSTTDRFKCNEGRLWICYSCKGHLSKGKMPNMCHANGLAVSEMPQELQDLTYLELLMIKKKIVFLKVRDLKNSGMKQMKGKITNVPIQDEDVLKTAGILPRMEDELGTVNVAFKYMRKGPYYRKAELIRPKKINEALRYLEKNHPSYFNFPIEYLKDPKKYKFVNLPLIGYFEEDQANLKNLDDAYSFLENSKLLTELLSPLLQRSQENYQNFMHQLVVNKSPRGPDSFIHALFDQMR